MKKQVKAILIGLYGTMAVTLVPCNLNARAQAQVKYTSEIVRETNRSQFDSFVYEAGSKVREIRNDLLLQAEANTSKSNIVIDMTVFTPTQVRLNTEIFEMSKSIFNKEHVINEFDIANSNLSISFLDNMNPLIPIAMTIGETGNWVDTRYTWSSAIYSDVLNKRGVDLDKLEVSTVNADTYLVNGLSTYLGCGCNCSAGEGTHYHYEGKNDNDSLGPLQVLRRYVEDNGAIVYDCGATVTDLMSWQDNVQYFTHNQAIRFTKDDNWNRDHVIQNDYELVALMGVAHNTGTSYLNSKSAGSLWRNSQSVYDYCQAITNEEALVVLNKYVDIWWQEVLRAQASGEGFASAGQYLTGNWETILKEIGINKRDYATSWGHKQYYPLKAVLNYMGVERLYNSGR